MARTAPSPTPSCAPPDPDTRTPGFTPPPGACDAHCHIFGPAARFAYAGTRSYTPPDSPLEDFLRLQAALGLERAVIVQASVQGADNATVLDAIARSGGRFRGVAGVADDITDGALAALNAGGIRGVRFSFVRHHGTPPDPVRIARIAERIAAMGWHVVLHAGIEDVTGNAALLAALPVPVVIDHMAKPDIGAGVDAPGFRALVSLMRGADFWIKISGAERHSAAGPPGYDDAVPFARALIEAAPDRVLWGTDWPHPNIRRAMPNDGDLLDLLARYAPDEAVRNRILVDNPARLYGFEE